jgi:hypothetical protein
LYGGSLAKTETFDAQNNVVATTKYFYETYSLKNSNFSSALPGKDYKFRNVLGRQPAGNQPLGENERIYYTRPTKQESMQDGISTIAETEYNALGQVKTEKVYDVDSKGDKAVFTTYQYLWETDAEALANGLYAPVVGVRKELKVNPLNWTTSAVLSNDMVIWKKTSNIWHEQKAYSWKRTGSPDFNYTQAIGANEPNLNHWDKLWEINTIDAKGNVLQKNTK